jgi:hypothetical protein
MKKMAKLVLLTALVAAAMTSLPTDVEAAKFCDYEYYYDAAHTQFAGYCYHQCAPSSETTCFGEVTEYYARVNCSPYCQA